MQRFANWLLWIIVTVIVALSVFNWPTLMMSAPIELLALRVEEPLGVIMVGLTGVLSMLFFIATLHNQIGSLLETNRMNKKFRRLQGDEDRVLSREISTLREQIQVQYDRLIRRLDGINTVAVHADKPEAI